jgi:arsenate reductase (glutaredoxin)
MLKIYHNPRCKKSREGLTYLQAKTDEYVLVEYLKSGLKEDDIKEILLKAHLKPFDLVRTQEPIYKKEFKGKNFTEEEWIEIIIENPKLLQRPVLVGKHKAVIAQPAEKVDEVVK